MTVTLAPAACHLARRGSDSIRSFRPFIIGDRTQPVRIESKLAIRARYQQQSARTAHCVRSARAAAGLTQVQLADHDVFAHSSTRSNEAFRVHPWRSSN